MNNKYIKSPMNYIGNKYRIINQIQEYFPKNIKTMVDLFCGGCDVTINTKAEKHYANDINYHVIDIFKEFQNNSPEYILEYIDDTIKGWNLSKTNKESYEAFRDYYSLTKKPLDLYILMCFSFNYQFRFNVFARRTKNDSELKELNFLRDVEIDKFSGTSNKNNYSNVYEYVK